MDTGTARLIYQAARFGQVAELKVLLQEHLPHGKVWQQYQDGLQDSRSDSSGASCSDLLEYVDKASGFTPLIASIYYHKVAAVEVLLDYGADVHNPGLLIRQSPLRVAVSDLNMDSQLVELLVSHGASPFLEDVDGMTPLDDVVRLRQNRVGRMPEYLEAVLLSLRRRCPFRGHLEVKIERLLGLSQTWRKFFCVLAPRERLPGIPTDLQLLIFSKNGFEAITRVWLTNASYSQIPMKTAHGKLCYELALSRKQMKRPNKLYTTGSSRTGFSMYVRALSTEHREADWVQRFVTLAATDPALVRNEGSDTHSQNMATGSDEEIRAAAARSIASKQRNQQGSGKLRSMSFSDSAHSSQQRQSPQPAKLRTGQSLNISRQVVAQYAENMEDTSPCTTSGSFQDEDSAYGPSEMYHVTQDSASSSQALPYPLHSSGVASSLHPVPQQQQGLQSGLGFMEPVAEVNEDGSLHSSHGAEPSQSALEHAPLLQSAPASQHQSQGGPSMKLITTPWANGRQAGWPEVEAVPFVSADDSLKRHWRTIALQGIEDDDSASEESVSESQHPVATPPQSHWTVQQPQTDLLPPLGTPHTLPQTHTQNPSGLPQEPFSSHLNPSYEQTPLQFSNLPPLSASPLYADSHATVSTQDLPPPPVQTNPTEPSRNYTDTATSTAGLQQATAAPAEHQHTAPAEAQQPSNMSPVSMVSLSDNTGIHSSPQLASSQLQSNGLASQDGHFDFSDLESVRQRSIALDIPSAELLDSILEFANNCCGPNIDDILASLPLDGFGRIGDAQNLSASGWQHHSQSHAGPFTPPQHTPSNQPGLSHASVCSVEPFSDDDDVTILDTTEIIKKTFPPHALTQHVSTDHWSPQSVHTPRLPSPLPPAPQSMSPPSPSVQSLHSDGYSLVDASHPDAATDLVFEMNPNSSHYFPRSSSNGSIASSHHSNNSVPSKQVPAQSDQRVYTVYDSDPHLLTTIPEYDGRSQQLSTGSSHSRQVDGDYLSHSSSRSPSLLHPNEFRDMVDQLIASGEHQAAQNQASHVSVSGGAEQLHSSGGMHPIWEDEEDCHIHGMPCKVTIGGLATV